MSSESTSMLAERTDELLSRGRSQGFISAEDVADLLQEGDLSAAEVEEFYAALEEESIPLVEAEPSPAAQTDSPLSPPGAHDGVVPEAPAAQIVHAVVKVDTIR